MSINEKVKFAQECNGVTSDTAINESTNNCDSETNVEKRFFNDETLKKLKTVAAPVGLLIALMIYTAVGGLVFRHLELPTERARLEILRDSIRNQRHHLIGRIINNTNVANLATVIRYELREYENVVQDAAQSGLLVRLINDLENSRFMDETDSPRDATERWTVLQAVFFASTVLTTIGYGNVVPATSWGRIFCILFAFVGIPFTLTVIADWGKLFAEAVSTIASKIGSKLPISTTSWMPTNLAGRRSLGAFAAALLLFIYLACGAGMFMLWEEEWDFFEGFYFCFVTMTTIGFGDLVPKKPKYMLLCTLYILVGLALTGTIIELVRRQYAQSWRRLQALSGPLAEALKRLGEHAGGDMAAFNSDLRKVLTVISMPRLKRTSSGRNGAKDREWEEAVEAVLRDIAANSAPSPPKKPIVQIIVYESSV